MDHFIDSFLQGLGIVLCLIILARAEPAINRMGGNAPPAIVRLAFALLVTGAVAGILGILAGNVPDASSLILAAGTAALIFCERRIRLLTRIRPNRKGLNPKGLNHAPR